MIMMLWSFRNKRIQHSQITVLMTPYPSPSPFRAILLKKRTWERGKTSTLCCSTCIELCSVSWEIVSLQPYFYSSNLSSRKWSTSGRQCADKQATCSKDCTHFLMRTPGYCPYWVFWKEVSNQPKVFFRMVL